MQLASASVLPMVLKSALELDLLEIIVKSGPGASLSPAEIAAQLPTKNPEAPDMLDRICRLLASYSVLTCSLRTLPDGTVQRLYGAAPVCKFLTKNEDGVSIAALALMNQDKVLICHDWSDEHCLRFLKNCYEALPANGKVIVCECILPVAPDSSLATKNVVHIDCIMLAHNPGGKERTQSEFESLCKGAGFKGFRVLCSAFNTYVMEFLKTAA
ncbi:unnamed protein product [Linum tenue]|uniref:Uncharacterized protein n=1 Tax=Linum tenue TaxID=586396 RepID=A0AAV0N3L9_9ROSI|nr:unnamed protein product [Linum tenue]